MLKDKNRLFPTSVSIKYIVGDATYPISKPFCIAHICNNDGRWGKGFVLAISKRWKEPENEYLKLKKWKLGEVQWVHLDGNFVANMIAQNGVKSKTNKVPVDYSALDICLEKLYQAIPSYYTVHMPRIGTGLGGGKWDKIEALIQKHIRVDTYVYNYWDNLPR